MITKYIIRKNDCGRDKPIRYCIPYPIFAYHDTELSALKEIKKIENKIKNIGIDFSITKTTYANETDLRNDFHLTSSYVWTSWFHGYEFLDVMIDNLNNKGE